LANTLLDYLARLSLVKAYFENLHWILILDEMAFMNIFGNIKKELHCFYVL